MKAGAVIEEVEIPLEANGQQAQFIDEMFTRTDTSDFLGSVRCTAPGRFTGVALEMDAGNRIFTTLPVVAQGYRSMTDANLFGSDSRYRILTHYGQDTEIDLSSYLDEGLTGATFTLKSCDAKRSDYYDQVRVENGKLFLTSNTLGHIHGINSETETLCTVTGTGGVSQDLSFYLHTVSAATPPPLAPGALIVEIFGEREIKVRVESGASPYYVRLGWRAGSGPAHLPCRFGRNP